MKLAIFSYGDRILRKKCIEVEQHYPNLETLIKDMWETMQNANGCGLAAPQIGKSIKIFIVDSKTTYENFNELDRKSYFDPDDKGIMETFINARIIERSKDFWDDEEGCLSIPNLSQAVKRPWRIKIEYFNENFEKKIRVYSGTTARIIQHEYDHTEGVLFIDHLKPLTRKLLESRLKKIAKGQIKTSYLMKFCK